MIVNPKIFILDDDPIYRSLYEQMLKTNGFYDVKTFEHGQDLINSLDEEPEIVFVDFSMEPMDGLDVLKKIKRINPDIYVIFLSGQEDIDTAVNALKYGAFDYIAKGYGDDRKITRVLSKIQEVRTMLIQNSKTENKGGFLSKFLSILSLIVILFISLSSCSSQNLFERKNIAITGDTASFRYDPSYCYRINKDDKISISVWGHDDMSVGSIYGIYNSNEVYGKWLLVDNKGEVSVPRIGNIKALGLTISEFEDSLHTRFKKLIVDPIIEARILNKEATVLGEVNNPGIFLLEKEQNTLVEILGKSGGFDFYADKKAIRVTRMVDGVAKQISVDLTRLDKTFSQNLMIQPRDVIFVPTRKGKMWDKKSGTAIPIASLVTTLLLAYNILH